MIDYSRELKAQLQEIEKLIMKARKQKKNFDGLEEGSMRVCASKRWPQYYFKEKGASKEKYIPAKDKEFVRKIMQRDYNLKALRKLEEMQHELERFVQKYDVKEFERLYDELCEARKAFVTPLEMSRDAYIEKWMNEHPGGQNPYPEQGKYETERGEIVRSKSEKIIADTLYKMNVPYQYEPKIVLDDHRCFIPDFECLNVRIRKTFAWEHLGLLNSNEYASKNFSKLEVYEKNGILLGDSLIITLETPDNPLDVALIRRKIETFLK